MRLEIVLGWRCTLRAVRLAIAWAEIRAAKLANPRGFVVAVLRDGLHPEGKTRDDVANRLRIIDAFGAVPPGPIEAEPIGYRPPPIAPPPPIREREFRPECSGRRRAAEFVARLLGRPAAAR